MGDISVMARRLADRKSIQYGWSGNGGYFSNVGSRLLCWYNDPEKIDYLFSLGQLGLIGKPGSENGGEAWILTHQPDGTPHWTASTERMMFSQIAFIDYGYFYDADNVWYYVVPGPFRIKIPLEYIEAHLDDDDREFKTLERIERRLLKYIFEDYAKNDSKLQSVVASYDLTCEKLLENLTKEEFSIEHMFDRYKRVYRYFDDWVVVKTKNYRITNFLIRPKQENQENRIETIDW